MKAKPIVIYGKTYRSLEDMPPDIREKYELAMCLLGDEYADHIRETFEPGDCDEAVLNDTKHTINISTHFGTKTLRPSPPLPVTPMTTPEALDRRELILIGLFALLCGLGATGVWYLFLR